MRQIQAGEQEQKDKERQRQEETILEQVGMLLKTTKRNRQPGVMVCAFNPRTWAERDRWISVSSRIACSTK